VLNVKLFIVTWVINCSFAQSKIKFMILNIIGLLLVVNAILGWFWSEKNKFNLLKIVHGAFVVLSTVLLLSLNQSEEVFMISSLLLGGFILLHLVLSNLVNIKNDLLLSAGIAASAGLLFLVPTQSLNIRGFETSLISIELIIPFVIGAFITNLAEMKEKAVGKLFKLDFKSQRGISRSVYLVLFGFGLLISHFLASSMGVLFFSLGFAIPMFYGKRSGALWNMLLGLTMLSTISVFSELGSLDLVALDTGRVLAGLFVALGAALLVNTLQRARNNKMLANAIIWSMPIAIAVALVFAGVLNNQFGGVDAFIGLLVGFTVTAFLGLNIKKNIVLFGIYLSIGLFLIPAIYPKMEGGISIQTNANSGSSDVTKAEAIKSLPIDFTGEYKIVSASSTLTFEL
jgi:hypothetical protein